MPVIEVNNDNFEQEVKNADKPVLVDFWAEWCAPCRMIGPIVEEIAQEYGDRLKVVKVDVDGNQALAATYNVMSIPTLLLFKNGRPVEQVIGALGKDSLLAKIKPHLEG